MGPASISEWWFRPKSAARQPLKGQAWLSPAASSSWRQDDDAISQGTRVDPGQGGTGMHNRGALVGVLPGDVVDRPPAPCCCGLGSAPATLYL